MRLRLTRRATRELAEIGAYVAERNPPAARKVEAELRSSLRLIAEHPRAGRLMEKDVRRFTLPSYPYLIFYRVAVDVIEVVAIRHAARSPDLD